MKNRVFGVLGIVMGLSLSQGALADGKCGNKTDTGAFELADKGSVEVDIQKEGGSKSKRATGESKKKKKD